MDKRYWRCSVCSRIVVFAKKPTILTCGGKKATWEEVEVLPIGTRERLAEALEAARNHLEYCGYGDAWERECARADKLEEKIRVALGEVV